MRYDDLEKANARIEELERGLDSLLEARRIEPPKLINLALDGSWRTCAMHDSVGRRGLWYRNNDDEHGATPQVEICAGREGDDSYVSLRFGDVVTRSTLHALEHCLATAAWVFESYGNQTIIDSTESASCT